MRPYISQVILLTACCLGVIGCGAKQSYFCPADAVVVSPAAVVLEHNDSRQKTGVHFSLSVRDQANCPPLPLNPEWTVSDPTRVSIDKKTGVALCLAPTDGPVTVTAAAYAGSATLICR